MIAMLGLLAFVAFLVGIVLLIISAIRKKPKKNSILLASISFVAFIVCLIATPTPEPTNSSAPVSNTESSSLPAESSTPSSSSTASSSPSSTPSSEAAPSSSAAPVSSSVSSSSLPTISSSSAVAVSSKAPEETPPQNASIELCNGHFTAGVDFPAGKYNITAVSGGGNVSSDNAFTGGINAIMGVGDDEMYEKEYKNIQLSKGTVLSVSNVTVKIDCAKPDGATSPREQPNTEAITLSNGNFVSGEDFTPGVYNIVAASGNGNVSSDNIFDGGINAIMGVDADAMYQKEYKNIELPKGTTLTLSGVEVKLVPSK